MPAPVARLVLLNGMPGVGKSTVAERYVEARAGSVLLDIDRLHRAARLGSDVSLEDVRTRALSRAAVSLAGGQDVVIPQLVARVEQLARFERVADECGSAFVHVVLVDAGGDPIARFHRRAGADPWHREARTRVADEGGDAVLEGYAAGLADVVAATADARVVRSVEGAVDDTVAALVDALAQL